MVQAGTNGQTNVTQSDSTGNQKMDISPIDSINKDMSLEDIAGLYTNLGHQYAGIAEKSLADIGNRQTERIGNDFGLGNNSYLYNQYYEPAANDFQSQMRVEGTQRALEEGMARSKAEAEAAAAAAKSNYADAQSALDKLQKARQNVTLVTPGAVGGKTSAQEVLNYNDIKEAGSVDEIYHRVAPSLASDSIVDGNWNIKGYRESATNDTLSKFGVSQEQYNNWSEEERQNFWNRHDVGNYWTNRYAYTYAEKIYGKDYAESYQHAYEYNYSVIKGIFDSIKSGVKELAQCPAYFEVMGITKSGNTNNITEVNGFKVTDKFVISKNEDDTTISYMGVELNTIDIEDENYKNLPEEIKARSIYNFLDDDGKKKFREAWNAKKKVAELYQKEVDKNSYMNNPEMYVPEATKAKYMQAYLECLKAANDVLEEKISVDEDLLKHFYGKETKVGTEKSGDVVNQVVESAFGVDMESISYLAGMYQNNPEKYNQLVYEYSLVAASGQVFGVADGKTTYHTAQGDKVLDAGTYVMYTLPGFQDNEGNYLSENLKRYMELREQIFSATADDEKLDEELEKAYKGYQKELLASLSMAASADCDVTTDITHSVIFGGSTAKSAREGTVFNGKTVNDVIEKFSEIIERNPEEAYTLFTKIVQKSADNSGSYWASYAGQLKQVSNKDSKGRNWVGSELVSSKGANTLFTEGDIDNLTVEQATALFTTIATSIDRWNKGNKEGNISAEFLTADGLNWFNKTGIALVKGVASTVDFLGNTLWTGLEMGGASLKTIFTGDKNAFDNVGKSKRWFGLGGITGNWTGGSSLYNQFMGEYESTSFGYGEDNQARMTDNLTHLVNPVLEYLWFDDDDNTQLAIGTGRSSDEGFNYRSAMNFSSELVGFVGSIFVQNLLAKGVAFAGKIALKGISKLSTAMAGKLTGTVAKGMLSNTAKVANGLIDAATSVSKVASKTPIDEILNTAANSTDDAAKIASNYVDDAAKAVTSKADDTAYAVKNITNKADDVLKSSGTSASEVARTTSSLQKYGIFSNELSNATNKTTKVLGALAAATTDTYDDVMLELMTYSKKYVAQYLGVKQNSQIIKDLTSYFGKNITKSALTKAHLAMYSGMSIEELSQLPVEALTVMSNIASAQSGMLAGVPKGLTKYLSSLSDDGVKSMLKELVGHVSTRLNAGGAWKMEDTIRFLAQHGWDSKRLQLLTSKWLKNQLQDIGTDILYGYIRPTVTNEGTDRETIDEYLTNPMNYIFNLGASGLQYIGGRIATNTGNSINSWRLDRAQRALASTVGGAADEVERKFNKVMKLTNKAQQYADKALERGKTLDQVKSYTDKAHIIADDAIKATNAETILKMSDKDFATLMVGNAELADNLNKKDIGFLRRLYANYTNGDIKANAQYFYNKKGLNTEGNGLGWIKDQKLNGDIWDTMIQARHDILREMNITRGTVTREEQKKIYRAMTDAVVNKYGKVIPGLRNSLDFYFNELMDLGDKLGKGKKQRAGYLPIESLLNVDKTEHAGVRGFSKGNFVLDAASASPELERSIALRDSDIIAAIRKGDTEITLKDAKGNVIVDEHGVAMTRELNPDGMNFLDSLTNAYNARLYEDLIAPQLGRNSAATALAAMKNCSVIINAKGGQAAAIAKDIVAFRKTIKELEEKAFTGAAAKADNTSAKTRAAKKAQQIAENNPRIAKAAAEKKIASAAADEKINLLKEQKNTLTDKQREFPAVVMGFVDKNNIIDRKAGYQVFNHYQALVKNDIKKFQAGDLMDTIVDPYYDFSRSSWEYGRDTFFGKRIKDYSQHITTDDAYRTMLAEAAANNGQFSKDMVMKRMLMAQETAPILTSSNGAIMKDDLGNAIVYSTKGKNGKVYTWNSPLQFTRTAFITDDPYSNMGVRNFQRRGAMGEGHWRYQSEKGRAYTTGDFDRLKLDSAKNVNIARQAVINRLIDNKVVPINADGTINKTTKNMIDIATAEILVRAKGSSKSGAITVSFDQYVNDLSKMLADQSTYMKAFQKNSGYYDIFTDLNKIQNNGFSVDDLYTFLEGKITKADRADAQKAWGVLSAIEGHNKRAVGLGDEFDAGKVNEEGFNPLFESSKEAIAQNDQGAFRDPYDIAVANDVASRIPNEKPTMTSEYMAGRVKSSKADEAMATLFATTASKENFEDSLVSFKKMVSEFMNSNTYKSAAKNRTDALNKLHNNKNTGALDKANSLIKEASGISKTTKARIDDYARQRQRRQKAYGNIPESANDPLKAFGGTDIDTGYNLTQSPAQYRAAKHNVGQYDQNAVRLNELRDEFKLAEDAWVNRPKDIGAEEAQALAGKLDEARKRFNNAMEDAGLDLTHYGSNEFDFTGYSIDYDRQMLMGGTLEGKAQQAIDALELLKQSVREDMTSVSKESPKAAKYQAILDEADKQIASLEQIRDSLPASEKITGGAYNYMNANESVTDSLELGLAFTMSDLIEDGDTNGMFTSEQLSSVASYDNGYVRKDNSQPVNISKEHPDVITEFSGDLDDPDGVLDITLRDADGDYIDVETLTPEEIAQYNKQQFENNNSAYRYAIVNEGKAKVEPKLTKEFSYGADQPQYNALKTASDAAEYKQSYLELKQAVDADKRTLNARNADDFVSVKETPSATLAERIKTNEAELKRITAEARDKGIDPSTFTGSLEDAKTDAWMAKKELDDFVSSHSESINDINTVDNAKKIAELKKRQAEAIKREAEAREFGDLSENEEYHAARRELAQINSELEELETSQKRTLASPEKEPSPAEADITYSPDAIESYGAKHGRYQVVKLAGYEGDPVDAELNELYRSQDYDPIEHNADTSYVEWLAFSKEEDKIQQRIDKEIKRTEKAKKTVEAEADKELKTKVTDPDDATKKVSYAEVEEDAVDGKIKEKLSEEDYEAYKRAKEGLENAEKQQALIKKAAQDKKTTVKPYRDRNGIVYLADNSPLIENFSTYQTQLESRGFAPLKSKEDVPAVDVKADKANQKAMNKAITKNRHAGDVFESRLEDWEPPKDKKGNYLFDSASKNETIKNMETLYAQIKKETGLDLSRKDILMNNSYADLLTRIDGDSTEAGKLAKVVNAFSNFSQAVQNIQLAGGAGGFNALTIAQMRGAIFQNPLAMKEYIKVVGDMRNSHTVGLFALENLETLGTIVSYTGDTSILDDFGTAISSRPGVSDNGVMGNMMTNLLNVKKDFINAKIDNDGKIMKSLKDIIKKDVQDTIFEDATFKNAMPVLRAKMLVLNYDNAVSQLVKKFPNADSKIIAKAASQMSYAKTLSFFDPYHTAGLKKATDVLDNTFTKQMRDFAATMVNAKSQPTVLDTLTNFFFALRYKMMLAGRVYDGTTSALPGAVSKVKGRAVKELTDETFDTVMDTMGTAFMHHGAVAGIGSLASCAVVAALSASALGIPTAWDSVSFIDEYDGSFKIPDVLLKFQTIGQIWLPNTGNFDLSKGIDWGKSVFGMSYDPTQTQVGIDTMSSIFTLQNSLFRTIDRTINPETYYAAPQRGIIGSASSADWINQVLNSSMLRAIGDEAIGSNLLSPYKAVYEVIMDSTYFGNNIWEKRKLPDGKDNPNYDFGRNVAASIMHILGLDQVLDGGKGYNSWVKGVKEPGYVEQDQIGTVAGSGILQHEFFSAAVSMMEGKYIEAVTEAGELPIKMQNLSSKARTEFNTRVKNTIASYSDDYKKVTSNVDSTNDMKDAAYAEFVKKTADAVATWSKKYGYVLGKDQSLVPYVSRTMMAMLSGEYDDNMYYVQDAYWKASAEAQIEGVTSANYWLDDADLEDWVASGKSAEDFAAEKQKRTNAYNKAMDEEYLARKALIEANKDADGNEVIKGLEEYLTDRYSYSDFKAEQRTLNKEIYASIHKKLDMPVGEFSNYKEMKAYYESLINSTDSKAKKVNIAMRYNTYVFDLIAPYAEKYGANIVNDAYYNGKGLSQDLASYVILPADKTYYGKTPVANYIKDVFNVGYRDAGALPTDKQIYEKFIVAQNLMSKGAIASSISVLDSIINAIKKGDAYASDRDYSKIINMRAILSARSK